MDNTKDPLGILGNEEAQASNDPLGILGGAEVKKKDQTKPTQAAPLPGLGGASKEPSPSPYIGGSLLEGEGLGAVIPTKESRALSEYEKNQKALSQIDKRISAADISKLPIKERMLFGDFESKIGGDLDDLKRQRVKLFERSKSLISQARDITNEIVSSEISDKTYSKFLSEEGTSVDAVKVGDLARKKAAEYGLPESGYFFELVKNTIDSAVESKRIEDGVDKNFKKIMREKHGLSEKLAPEGIQRKASVVLGGEKEPSTVLMAHYGDYSPPDANGKYAAFPTLFPKDPKKQTSDPNDWILAENEDEAYEIAKRRNEVLYFDTPEEAEAVAKGSWKKSAQEQYVESIVKRSSDAIGVTKLINERDLSIASIYDATSALAKDEVEKMEIERYGKPASEYAGDIKRQLDAQVGLINSQFGQFIVDDKFTGTQEQFDAYRSSLEAASNQAQEQIDQIVAQEIKDVAAVNSKYDLRYRRQADEIAQMYSDRINDKMKVLDPIIRKELESVYKSAVGKFYEDENMAKKAAQIAVANSYAGPAGVIASFAGKPFAKAVLDQASTYLRAIGSDKLAEYTKNIANSNDIGHFKLDTGADFLDPLNVIGATGQIAGGMVPTLVAGAVVTASTGGVGWLPVLAAGATGFVTESIAIAQEAEEERFAATGSATEAAEAKDRAWRSQIAIMPMYALDGFGVFGKIGGGIFKRAAIGGLAEWATETLQEYPQSIFEQVIRDDKSLSEALDYVSFDGFKRQVLNLAPVALMGIGGQVVSANRDRKIADAAKTMSARMNIGPMTDTSIEQYMLQLTTSKGSNFALAVVDSQLRTGNITELEAERATKAIVDSNKFIESSKDLRISAEAKLALATFNMKIQQTRAAMEAEVDPDVKSDLEARLKSLKKQSSELTSTGSTNYAVVSFKNNTFEVLTPGELEIMTTNDKFISSFSNGDITIQTFGPDEKKMSDMVKGKVEPSKTPVDTDAKPVAPSQVIVERRAQDRESVIIELQKAREELGIHVDDELFNDISEDTENAIDKLDNNEPLTWAEAEKASQELYKKYKQIAALRNDPNRLHTIEQIDSMLEAIGQGIDALETYIQNEQADIKGQAYVKPVAKSKTGTETTQEVTGITSPTVEQQETQTDAVQEQEAGKVPVQPEAGVGQEVAQGAPQTESQIVTEEGIQEEITSTTDEEIDAIERSLDEQGLIVGALTGRSTKRKVLSAAISAKRFMETAIPHARIKLYETADEYMEATGRSAQSAGSYNTGNQVISINLELANARTVAHEVFHALLDQFVLNEDQISKMSLDLIGKVMKFEAGNKALMKNLEKFANYYTGYSDGLIAEEQLAEFIGYVAANYNSLTERTKRAVKEFFDSVIRLMKMEYGTSVDDYVPDTKSDKDLVEVLKRIAENIATGEVDLKAIDTLFASIDDSVTDSPIAPRINAKDQLTEGTNIKLSGTEPVVPGSIQRTTLNRSLSNDGTDPMLSDLDSTDFSPSSGIVGLALRATTGSINGVTIPFRDMSAHRKLAKLKREYQAINSKKGDALDKKAQLRKKIHKESISILTDMRDVIKGNLMAIYDSLSDEFIEQSKQWYDGANRFANAAASTYGVSVDQAAAIIAVLSPQNKWHNNLSQAERVMDILSNHSEDVITKRMAEYSIRRMGGGISANSKSLRYAFRTFGEVSISELMSEGTDESLAAASLYLVALDQNINSPSVPVTGPTGKFVGFQKSEVFFMTMTNVAKAINVFYDGSQANIDVQLGKNNKVRNFYNNISNPSSDTGHVTVDTHANAAAFGRPMSSDDAKSVGLFGEGGSLMYFVIRDAYVSVAKEIGMFPRQTQSVLWEAVISSYNNSSRKKKDNEDVLNQIKELESENINSYEKTTRILERQKYKDPEWAKESGINVRRKTVPGVLQAGGDRAIQRGGKRDAGVVDRRPSGDKKTDQKAKGREIKDQKIHANIDFKNRFGKYFSVVKTFNDQRHLDNYIGFMERSGNKEIGTTILPDAPPPITPSHPFSKRDQLNAPLFSGKNRNILNLANEYVRKKGLPELQDVEIRKLNTEYSKEIADVYEAAEDNPLDKDVQRAYKALAEESKEQFDILIADGYTVELWGGSNEPYKSSTEMLEDLRKNKHLYIFSTEEGFGEGEITEEKRRENPMLHDSGYKDMNGKKLLLNDLFRFVHDAFGHGKLGNSFGPIGEENAWFVHSQMFSPDARRAMTSETRGQNSWVNFGPQLRNKDGSLPQKGDKNYIPPSKRDFAVQKNFLFPDQYVFDRPNTQGRFEKKDQNVKIEKSSARKNVEAIVDFLKSVKLKDEGGATLNIDGTRYDGGGIVLPVDSMNMDQKSITSGHIVDFIVKNEAKLSNDSFKIGVYKFPNSSFVSVDLNILVPNEKKSLAIKIGKALNQESIFDLNTGTNIKTGGTGIGTVKLTDKEVYELADDLAKNMAPRLVKDQAVLKKRGFLGSENVENLSFLESISDVVFESPEAFYEPQVLEEIKRNGVTKSEGELISDMTIPGLYTVMNTIGSTNNNNAVLAAAELIERSIAQGQDIAPLVIQLNKMGTTVGQLLRQFGELKKSTMAGRLLSLQEMAKQRGIALTDAEKKKASDLMKEKEDLIKSIDRDIEKRMDPGISVTQQVFLDNQIESQKNKLYEVDMDLHRFLESRFVGNPPSTLTTIMVGNMMTIGSGITNLFGNINQFIVSVFAKIPASSFDAVRAFVAGSGKGIPILSGPRTTSSSARAYIYGGKHMVYAIPDALRILFWKGPKSDYYELKTKDMQFGMIGLRTWFALAQYGLPVPAEKSMFDKLVSLISKDLGEKKYGAKAGLAFSYAMLGTFGIPADIIFRFLRAGDVMFTRPWKATTLYEIGKRRGLSGEQLENMLKYPSKKDRSFADEIAKEATFQEESAIAKESVTLVNTMISSGSKIFDKAYAKSLFKLLARTVWPFVQVPANMMNFTIKLTVPALSFVVSSRYLTRGDHRKAALNFGIGSVGLAVTTVASALAANGIIQALGDDDDPKLRALKYISFPPGTINKSALKRVLAYIEEGYSVGGVGEMSDRLMKFYLGEVPEDATSVREDDEFFSYLKLGVVGFVFGVWAGADRKTAKERAFNGVQQTFFESTFMGTFKVPQTLKFVKDQSFMKGTSTLLKALDGNEYDVQQWFLNTFKAFAGIALPNQLSAIARTQMEYMPDLKDDDMVQQFKNAMNERIFFMEQIPESKIRVDLWGRKIPQTPDGADKYMYHLGLDPLRSSSGDGNKLSFEVYNLYNKTGDVRAVPPAVQDYFMQYYKGESQRFNLTASQVNRLQAIVGSLRYNFVYELVNSQDWQLMTDDDKLDELDEIWRKTSKHELVKEEKKRMAFQIIMEEEKKKQ